MQTNFMTSQTRINLMRAFAGESQARNRYTFAKQAALEQNLYVISEVFRFTAEQEEQHAKIFYELLKEGAGKNVEITAGYPADVYDEIEKLLESAIHNEHEEFSDAYPSFAKTAQEEGFPKAASKFSLIAEIENIHKLRFMHYSELMREGKLFRSDGNERWMCLNCGHIHEGSEAPLMCPVCGARQGYFIRENEAPFTSGGVICQG
ncbi:MAG: rubrerythrin family protein [Ruminococcus sp.]|nr:rubrerythrin family protein [Ruminococcus sp.]MCD7810749.1 rubrerythrin family protein [Ruminococcus sp.]